MVCAIAMDGDGGKACGEGCAPWQLNTSPVSIYSCCEYNLNANGTMLQSSITERVRVCVLTIMAGLHSNSHPFRDNNIIFFPRLRKQLFEVFVCVCEYTSTCMWTSFFWGGECVWVTAAAAALCCHGDS